MDLFKFSSEINPVMINGTLSTETIPCYQTVSSKSAIWNKTTELQMSMLPQLKQVLHKLQTTWLMQLPLRVPFSNSRTQLMDTQQTVQLTEELPKLKPQLLLTLIQQHKAKMKTFLN